MEICEITLDAKQYDLLKSMLNCDRRADLIRKIPINGNDLFCDMIHEIYSPVIDGWSTLEIVLKESDKALDLLRFMTKQIFPASPVSSTISVTCGGTRARKRAKRAST